MRVYMIVRTDDLCVNGYKYEYMEAIYTFIGERIYFKNRIFQEGQIV